MIRETPPLELLEEKRNRPLDIGIMSTMIRDPDIMIIVISIVISKSISCKLTCLLTFMYPHVHMNLEQYSFMKIWNMKYWQTIYECHGDLFWWSWATFILNFVLKLPTNFEGMIHFNEGHKLQWYFGWDFQWSINAKLTHYKIQQHLETSPTYIHKELSYIQPIRT